jgi:hypothetical protein
MAARKKTTAKKAPTRGRGRPVTEMTPENIEAIMRSIRLGLHPQSAAMAAGVSVGAFKAHKSRHPDFVAKIKEAENEAQKSYISRLISHTDKQWTACAWILERRWPELWRKRDGEDMQKRIKSEPVKSQKDMHTALVEMVNAAIAGKITFKQLKDMAQSLGIASDISERADLEERIKKLEGNG